MTYEKYINRLSDLGSGEKFREFHSNLAKSSLPVIGVRTPDLRKLAKEIQNDDWRKFVSVHQPKTLDEAILHGIIIATYKYEDYRELIHFFDLYLPKIDSWASCDCFCSSFKVIKSFKTQFILRIDELLRSSNSWEKRVAFVMLLTYYRDSERLDLIFDYCSKFDDEDDYYVSMAVAWLLATLCVDFPQQTAEFISLGKISNKTYKRTIQKIKDSYRIKDKTLFL